MITVADYIACFLESKGIKHLFGFQGSAMMKMLDSIEATNKITYVQNFNEQASAFGADAYARVTNEIGVAIATSGPGATNLITGIADAFCDSIPVLFITGQERTSLINSRGKARQNGFQDADIVSMVKPVTKYTVLLDQPENVRYELEKAFYYATTGRKGPVLIDVPIDVQFKEVDENNLRSFSIPESEAEDLTALNDIATEIKKAKRPLILVGGGVRSANTGTLLDDFCKKTGIPLVATLNGLDACTHIAGFAGLYGNTAANLALLNADLLLIFGARLASQHTGKERAVYNGSAKIIRVEIDETEFGRTAFKEDILIPCDLRSFFSAVLPLLNRTDFKDWNGQISSWKERYGKRIAQVEKGLSPVKTVQTVLQKSDENAVITVDVGENQMWAAQAFIPNGKRRFLSSSGFGAMGFSLPAAIGASFAADQVIAFMGDGGFQMNLQELNTLSLWRRNVKCFVFNNGCLGLMRSVQTKFYHSRFHGNTPETFTCPDLEKLAETFRLKFARFKTEKDFQKLNDVFGDKEPWLIDVEIDPDTRALNRYDDPALRKRIYLDFDGTLINSQGRLYRLFKELCPKCDLTEDEYNEIKRSRVSQKKLLQDRYSYTDEQIAVFHQNWMEKVEEEDRVEFDFPYAGVTEALEKLSKNNDLYLVTNRQRKDLVRCQIEKFGWVKFFKDLLITEGKTSKAELIRSATSPLPCDVLIGDTGDDIKCAKELGVHSIAVAWGILNKEVLSEYAPDFIAERIKDFDHCSFL